MIRDGKKAVKLKITKDGQNWHKPQIILVYKDFSISSLHIIQYIMSTFSQLNDLALIIVRQNKFLIIWHNE